MVGLTAALAGLKITILRHSSPTQRRAGFGFGVAGITAAWAAALLAGSEHTRDQLLMLTAVAVAAGWLLGPSLASGTGVLRPEFFRLLPLPRTRLSLALLGTGFVGVGAAVSLLLLAPLVIPAAAAGPVVIVAAAVPGMLLQLMFIVVLSRLFFAVLGAAMLSRFGVELSGIQYGALVAAIFTGWMAAGALVDSVPGLVRDGLPAGAATTGLAALPTSWPVRAVAAGAAGQWVAAAGWLLALAGLVAALTAVTTRLLVPAPDRAGPPRSRRRRPAVGHRRWVIPDPALGAVLGKELRLWRRDPWRRLDRRTMLWAALISAGVALLTGHAEYAPYAGLIIAFGAALAALNLYGQDGTAVWQLVVGAGPGTVRAEVRGRQLAVLWQTAPGALALTAVLVAVTGAHQLWPVLLALLPALLGAGSGLGMLLSVVAATPGVDPRHRRGPNDAGDVTFQVWVALVAIPLLLAPVATVAGIAAAAGSPALAVLAVGFGLAYGGAGAWWLGRIAHRRLAARLPEMFARLRYGPVVAPAAGSGWLDRLERSAAARARQRHPSEGL